MPMIFQLLMSTIINHIYVRHKFRVIGKLHESIWNDIKRAKSQGCNFVGDPTARVTASGVKALSIYEQKGWGGGEVLCGGRAHL